MFAQKMEELLRLINKEDALCVIDREIEITERRLTLLKTLRAIAPAIPVPAFDDQDRSHALDEVRDELGRYFLTSGAKRRGDIQKDLPVVGTFFDDVVDSPWFELFGKRWWFSKEGKERFGYKDPISNGQVIGSESDQSG